MADKDKRTPRAPKQDGNKGTPRKNSNDKSHSEAHRLLKPKSETVCRFFEKGECKNGSECPFFHPAHSSYSDSTNSNVTEDAQVQVVQEAPKLSNSILANKLLMAIRPKPPSPNIVEEAPSADPVPQQQLEEIVQSAFSPVASIQFSEAPTTAEGASSPTLQVPSGDSLQFPAIPPLPVPPFDASLQLPSIHLGPPPGIMPMQPPTLPMPPWFQAPNFTENFPNAHMMPASNQMMHPGHFDAMGQQHQMWSHMAPPGLNYGNDYGQQMAYSSDSTQGYAQSMMHMHPGAFRPMGYMQPMNGAPPGWQSKAMDGDGRGMNQSNNSGFSHDSGHGDSRHRDTGNRGNGDNRKPSIMSSFMKSKAGEKLSRGRADRGDGILDGDVEGAEDDHETEADNGAAKKTVFFRNTKRQVGELKIKIKNFKTSSEQELQNGFYMRPGNPMVVYWKLPLASLQGIETADFVIALLRYGSQVNMPSIVAKSINFRQSSVVTDEYGVQYRTGYVPFFAPKAAGQFVFRLFDQQTRESAFETLATSSMYSVVLIDMDIVSNLQHVLDAFQENLPAKAISQFTMIIRGIKSCLNNGKDCAVILNRCVEKIVEQVNNTFAVLDDGAERKRVLSLLSDVTKLEVTNESGGTAAAQEELKKEENFSKEDEEFWKNYRSAFKIHIEAHDALVTLRDRKTPWYLVTEKLKNAIIFMNSLYCPVLRRYFRNNLDLIHNRFEAFGFFPTSATLSFHNDAVLHAIQQSMIQLLPQLLPKADFQASRERARETIERSLLLANILPLNSKLAIYGSSGNNFGNDDADLDMCLIVPQDKEWTNEEKVDMIEKIGAVLSNSGMSEVSVRSSARIPIVQFKDPLSNQECDISLYNSLALANTRLLRIYSEIDPRVRVLAYIIKHWVKRRHMNSPQDGTLSSYGYILTLLHFLQSRPIPVIPDLQALPPSWNGPKFRPDSPEEQGWFSNVPIILEKNTADGTPCNTYFLDPSPEQFQTLRRIAAQNTESCSGLLLEYFRYYAWSFDYRHSVVSTRRHGETIEKIEKYERAAWLHTDNMSIEDPFETWYDVAHVIKPTQMTYIRKEYLRAYTLASRVFYDKDVSSGNEAMRDTLPENVSPSQFIDVLCEGCEAPTFIGAYNKKKTP